MKGRTESRKENKRKENEKKPFDKKKYRLKKYSNKFKVKQWEERRKKAVLRTYYKELEKDKRTDAKQNVPSGSNFDSKKQSPSKNKRNPFFAAREEFEKKKQEKRNKKEEALKIKAERQEALRKYKEKKMQIYKKLSKRTKKGQPVMKDRMELLFEKIQQSTQN